jgi:hypothetical protein
VRADLDKLMSRVEVVGDCWHWTSYVRTDGYGVFTATVDGKPTPLYAHRLMHEAAIGPIPDGMDVDHRCHDPRSCAPGKNCRHRRCVNPAHLQAVTRRTNTYRSGGVTAINKHKTHCKWGHEFTPENTAIRPQGGRTCRTCERDKVRRRRQTGSAA